MMVAKTRRYKTIDRWLRTELNKKKPDSVKYPDKVSKHIGGGPAAPVAFLNTLNTASGFRPDGLSLLPGDVPVDAAKGYPTVRHLMIAILNDYLRRDWKIS